MKKHTFAICAYQDSPYLEACIRSLKEQTVRTDIILCTSTPSASIHRLAGKYGIPVYVRDGKSDIQDDWNFAYNMAKGEYVTIAHQDDMYHKCYVKELLSCGDAYPDMTVFSTAYVTVKGHQLMHRDKIAWVKSLLRLPLRLRVLSHKSWLKKSVLMFGNSICCPSCSYHKSVLGETLFTSEFHYALDWDTLWKLAGQKGRFVCVEKQRMFYRVHEGATTKAWIEDNRRFEEESAMFRKFWPEPVVRLIGHYYRKAYDAYQ